MRLQVCIDESGDTGYSKKSSKHFVLCAVAVDDLTVLRRIARNIHRSKDSKKKANMLHAYNETEAIKNALVKKLSTVEIHCVGCIVEKKKVKPGTDLYLHATGKMARHFENRKVDIVIVANRDTRKSYTKMITEIYKRHNLKIAFSDPTKDKSLQVADFYSWSIYTHFEKRNSKYFEKLLETIYLL